MYMYIAVGTNHSNLFLNMYVGIAVTTNDGPAYAVYIHYALSKAVH